MPSDWPSAAARLDIAPPPAARAALDPAFGRRFLLFVDTEEEFDWSADFRRDATATTAVAALPGLHRRFVAGGARPVYLVDHPVAADPAAVDVLAGFAAAGEAEIGAQLHPWVNPPFDEPINRRNSFVGNLPRALHAAKLDTLTDRIATSFGQRPIVFRAGRYGVGADSAALLVGRGYRLDVSVRSLFAYTPEGGPDFTGHPVGPYWADEAAALLELPLGAAFTGALRRQGAAIFQATARVPRLRGLLARSGLLSRIALTPEGFPCDEACEAIRILLGEGASIISLNLHSTSAEPGHNPYVRDSADLRRLERWLDAVFGLLAREGVAAASSGDLLAAAWAPRRDAPPLASGAAAPLSREGAGGL